MDSIFPFISNQNVDVKDETELEELCEYAYDFENNCLLLDKDGKNYLVYRNEALKIWVFKALRTMRNSYTAYTEGFGNEMYDLIGQSIDIDILKLEIKRYVTEGLMFNPYIKELSKLEIKIDGSKTEICINIESVYGNIEYKDEWKEGV